MADAAERKEAPRFPDLARRNSFVFDFDSTLVTIETLDTLLKNCAGDDETRRRIDGITARAMNGELDFGASLSGRLRLARARTEHFARMAAEIAGFVTPGMAGVVDFLKQKGQELFIVSGGFAEIVRPAADFLGIPRDRCFANEAVAGEDGSVTGVRAENPLAHEGGKQKILRALRDGNRLPGTVVMLGDGMSDYGVYAEGLADLFIGCGFNAVRPNVKAAAPVFVESAAALEALLRGGGKQENKEKTRPPL
jgi:phosphoserine phosphatase SerB